MNYENTYAAPPANPMATAGMVLGIIGATIGVFLFILLWPVSLILGTLATIFGTVGLKRYKADPRMGGKGKAYAGIWLGIVALVFSIGGLALLASATA